MLVATCTIVFFLLLYSFMPMSENPYALEADSTMSTEITAQAMRVATFGAGCFWCVEAVFESLIGVQSVVSGYMGGSLKNPSYEAICTGTTGHAEVIQIHYDPELISYEHLLERFWIAHDPTTFNRQGADVGTQYRSAIFTHSDEQYNLAQSSKQSAKSKFADPIVTEISPASPFYPAENHHQNFYRENPEHPYCRSVIRPKLQLLKAQ